MTGQLWIEFIDESYEASPAAGLDFGRDAELVIDDANPYLHRPAGAFANEGGTWWVRNLASKGEMTVLADDGTRTVLPPSAANPLTTAGGVVRFMAGVTTYEIGYRLEDVPRVPASSSDAPATGATTSEFGVIRLNEEQRLLLAALAEPRLRDPHAVPTDLPANAEIAHQLQWSVRKFDRKLDYLCRRLSEVGVPGLRGTKGGEATDRRANLVTHVLVTGLIDERDLEPLDEHRD